MAKKSISKKKTRARKTREVTSLKSRSVKPVVGWREWVELPGLKIDSIKAKVDTGARTSSLHAYDLKYSKRSGREFVSFKVHPKQRGSKPEISCRAKVLEYRKVKSSNGQVEKRPVILTPVRLLGEEWHIEVTLTNRDAMGFRMLLGRESVRDKFYVDAGGSFYGNREKKALLKKVRKK